MWIVFSGAGISQESGIPTFEERPDLREVLTLDVWEQDPASVWQIVWDMFRSVEMAKPNPAHCAISEAQWYVVTQNIDGLHQRAGTRSGDILELHGDLRYAHCVQCGDESQLAFMHQRAIPKCSCGSIYKPNVVLYQEPVTRWRYVANLLNQACGVLVVGTSLTVNPASALPGMAERRGIPVHVINQAASREVPEFIAWQTGISKPAAENSHRKRPS